MPDCDVILSNTSNDNYQSLALVFKKVMFAYQNSVLLDGVLFCQSYFYFVSFCHLRC